MPKAIPIMGASGESVRTRAATAAAGDKSEELLRKRSVRRRVSVDRIRESPFQSPSRRNRSDVSDLLDSIVRLGLLNAPLVRKCEAGSYELISGHRRFLAWCLLVSMGKAPAHIYVDVLEGLSDLEAAFALRAANGHRDVGPVAEAEETGAIRSLLAAKLGREPTVRDLAPAMPKGRTAVAESLVIWRALQDPRLEALVRQADSAGKSLLLSALRAEDISTRMAALEAYGEGGEAAMRNALTKVRKGGRTLRVVTRKRRGENAYVLTVQVRPRLSAGERAKAISALRKAEADLRKLGEPADAGDPSE